MISGLETKDYGAVVAVLEHKTSAPAAVEARQVGTEGIVDAYVAVTGVRDDVGDIIEPGAFVDTLKRLRPKMCLGHDWNRPIGEPVEIEELMPGDPRLPAHDHEGNPWPREAGALWTRSRYMLTTDDGRNAYEHAKFYGPRTAYSIGYVPDKTKIRFTSEKGLRTRRLPKLDLYEYGPVLHGAHPLARQGVIKSGQPDLYEGKVRLVRNMEYWGLPVGTPIRPGMKPRGPIARRMERAGKPVDPSRGVVEVDAGDAPKPAGPRSGAAQEGALFTAPKSTMRIKPTARGVNKRNDGTFESDILTLFAESPEIDPDSDEFVTFDSTRGVPDRQKINKGEDYNPLDMLVANAVTPAELEEDLRNNSEWTSATRVGEVADANAAPEVDEFINNVMDVYREKYNAALVEQHGKDLPDDVAELDAEEQAVPDTPVAPKRSTTSLTTLSPQDLAAAVAEMDDAELAAHEQELAARAESLGKPGERNQAHQAIVDEQGRRSGQASTQVPTETPSADEPVTVVEEDRAPGYALPPQPDEGLADVAKVPDGRPRDSRPGVQPDRREEEQATARMNADAAEHDRGLAEGTENTPDNEIEDVSAGEQPSAVDGEMDTAEDIPAAETGVTEGEPAGVEAPEDAVEAEQEASEFEPGAVLDDAGRPLPRVPVNDAGDFYDDHGDIVSGSSEFDQALNQATDAINDGDETALADALAPFAGVVEPTPGSGKYDPTVEAARLMDLIPRDAVAEVQQWTDEANSRQGADFEVDRTATTGAFAIADDDYLATEAARMRGILIERSAAGDPANDGFVREAALRLRLLQAEQAKREQGGEPERDVTEPVTPQDAAIIAAEEIADAQDIADASHGIHVAEDGEFEADGDIADRQDRVAGLLAQTESGTLDLSGYDDDGLRNTRADVLGELRLQSYLETRRQQDRVRTRQEQEADDVMAGEVTRPDGEAGDVTPDEPPGPRPRPGVAGAAEDLADALDEGDEDRITATRARLEASLRRSRSTSEHVLALRTLIESGDDPDPAQLRALAEAIRVETCARRNASARERRRVRRFERERLRALLGDVEAAMTGRGLEFDAAPESIEDDAISAGIPGAGSWTVKTNQIDWLGYAVTVREVSGTSYSAKITSKSDGRSTYYWEISQPGRDEVLTGGGDTASPDDAVSMVELILDNHRARGVLPADAMLPRTAFRSDSSALPGDVVAARSGAIAERLAGGALNPLTGEPDPLRSQPTLIPPTVKAFDQPLDVREYLLAQVARETDDTKREQLASTVARIRWDDVILSPGGGLAVYSMPGQRGYHIMHTRSGLRADILINGSLSSNLPKADQARIMAIMESVPNGRGQVVDFNQDKEAVKAALDDFGSIAGPDSHSSTVGAVFIGEKLRSGNLSAGLLQTVAIGADNIGWHNRTNPARYHAVQEKTVALGHLLGNTKADKETRKTVRHGWALANAGAPDATAALYRRRAEELRQEFGAKAGDRGAVLLDEVADNLLAMWAPEQSQGDRVRQGKAGERFTITENDSVRHYRLLTDMRSTSDHTRQSEARVIDEATGVTYRLGIWNDFKHRDSLTLWPEDKGSYDIWSLPLSGDEFVITDGQEEAPDTAEVVRNRARADIQSVPQDVLDAAANLLAESGAEAEERRATGARSRTDRRAPRRTAATPPDEAPAIPGEQHLAAAQGRLLPGWIGPDYSETDAPAAGGFTSEQEWREFIAAERVRLADDYQLSRGLAVIDNPNYEKVTLSPGGHFVITSDNYVVHARSLQAVWGMGNAHWELTGGAKLTAASSMAVATHLERAHLNGQSVDWTKGADEIGEEVRGFTKANGNIVAPAARATFQRMLATGKTVRASDIGVFGKMTFGLGPEFTPPNPEALASSGWHKGFNKRYAYRVVGGARTESGHERRYVAMTKSGQALAKKIEFEVTLAESMAKVAPLDAVRRLSRIAEVVDGQTIDVIAEGETVKRDTLNPANDLRAIAKSITNAFDEKQITPAGMMLRHNMTGTVRGKATVTAQFAKDQSFTDERHGDITEVQVWADENGMPHARFGAFEIVDQSGLDGRPRDTSIRQNVTPGARSNGRIRLNRDSGDFSMSWYDISGIYTTAKFENWEFEPPASPGESGGDVVLDNESAPTRTGESDVEDRIQPDDATSEGGEAPVRDSQTQEDLNAGELRERLDDERESAQRDAPRVPGAPSPAGGDRTQEIENKVREIYDGLVSQPGNWAGIVDIRRQLGDQYDRAEVDAVLKRLDRSGVAVLAPESNRKALTEEMRAAAVRIGGDDNHIIMFKQA